MKSFKSMSGLLLAGALSLSAYQAQAGISPAPPTINLFPGSVIEQIKQTAEASRSLEASAEGLIQQLDQQRQLYEASKCDEASFGDKGCSDLKKNMRNTFIQILDEVEAKMPVMQRTMETTAQGLQQSIRTKVGRMNPRQLESLLSGGGDSVADQRKKRGRKQGTLSSRLNRIYQLVTTNKGKNNHLKAAGLYLDSKEALEYIDLIQQEIAQAKTDAALSDALGDFDADTLSSVDSVKALLYGDSDEAESPLPVALPVTEDTSADSAVLDMTL